MGKLIGLHINTEEDFSILKKIDKMRWRIISFEEGVDDFIAQSLGIEPEKMNDKTITGAYLGNEWSYIREEKFTSGERQPVRYYLSPKTIKRKLIDSLMHIHSQFLINMTLVKYKKENFWIVLLNNIDEIEAVREAGGTTLFYRPISMKGPGPTLSRVRDRFTKICGSEVDVLNEIEEAGK